MVAQGSTPKTDLPKEDANNSTLAPIINMQKFRDQTKIPHKVLESIEKGSPLEAMTHLEFRENIKYFRDKVIDVNNRPDKAFKEMEVLMFLKKCSRTIPILNDRKDYLIENSLLRDQAEFDEVMNMIVDTLKRPSVCNTVEFGMHRNKFAELTEQKTLRYGFEHIENIRQDISNTPTTVNIEQNEESESKDLETETVKPEETSPTLEIKADFKTPNVVQAGDSATFKTTSENATTYSWEVKQNGVIIDTILGSRDLNYVFPTEGNYSVTLFSTDGDKTVSTTKFVNVQANPEPQVIVKAEESKPQTTDTAELNTNLENIEPPISENRINIVTEGELENQYKPQTIIPLKQKSIPEIPNSPSKAIILTPTQLAQQNLGSNILTPNIIPIDQRAQNQILTPNQLAQQTNASNILLTPKTQNLIPSDQRAQNQILTPSQLAEQVKTEKERILQQQNLDKTIIIPNPQSIRINKDATTQIVQQAQPIITPPKPSFIDRIPKTNEVDTLRNLEKLSPLGRRAIWGMLTKTQRQHLIDHPYKENWQKPVDEIFDKIVKKPAKNVKNWADERSGFKGLRTNIKESINNFKKDRIEQLTNSAKNGNAYAKWIERKYLAYKRDKNNKQSIFKLAGYLGKEALKTLISPITDAYNNIVQSKFVNSIIKVIQGTGNFAGKSIGTVGRIAGGISNSVNYAFLPTLVSSLMGVNPFLAAGLFTSLGLAGQAFNRIDLLKNPTGFKIPFLDQTIRRYRVFNELRLNPQKYAGMSIVEFPKALREDINLIRTSPDLFKAGKWFTATKHLLKSVPMGAVATGLGFLATGNLPLALLLGGATMGIRAGAGYAVERLSIMFGRGLSSFPLFRHLFKFPGMSFLDAAEGSQWVNQEMKFIQDKGFGEWMQTQNDSVMQLGPVNVTRGMSNSLMLARTILGGVGITRFFTSIPTAISSVVTPGLAGSILSKIPLITKIAGPVAVLGYLGAVATGLATFSWATFLGITFGAVAGSLTFALLSSTGIGLLVGLPVSTAVSYLAERAGNWLGSFFDKTAEVINDMNIVGLIPIIQLGKALYDIVNTTIEEFSDYARIGLISLSIIPALGILMQIAQNQASANFESSNPTITTSTLNYEEDPSTEYRFKVDKYEYDCDISNQNIFYSELKFSTLDIITLTKSQNPIYNVKGKADSGESIIYKNMKNINPKIKINNEVKTGEIVGSC